MQAAQGQADYYITNLGRPERGRATHPGARLTPASRGAASASAPAPAGTNWAGLTKCSRSSPPPTRWTGRYRTVWHRYMYVHPSAVHVGYGTATDGDTTVTVFNVGLSPRHTADAPLPARGAVQRSHRRAGELGGLGIAQPGAWRNPPLRAAGVAAVRPWTTRSPGGRPRSTGRMARSSPQPAPPASGGARCRWSRTTRWRRAPPTPSGSTEPAAARRSRWSRASRLASPSHP